MSCFPCFQRQRSNSSNGDQGGGGSPPGEKVEAKGVENRQSNAGNAAVENINVAAKAFTFRELATATKNFRQECLLGEGGFGRVFRGVLASTGQVVAVKQMDRNIIKGDNKEFLNEVSSLGRLNHSNLLNLIGYCADGDQRLLVFEFMPGGSLENHLLGTKEALDWSTRIKIAFGAAKGVEYLHCKANPPVVYQNIKPSNILLDEDFNPKIADFGLSKLGPSGGDKLFGPSRAIGTYGYSAPECAGGNDPTAESDVYTFGVILLQLITGRKALDTTRPNDEQNLVAWAQPFFKDPKRFPDMADPLLHKQYPEKDLNQSVAVAAMCLQEEPAARPMMSDVVTTLSFIWMTAEKYVPSPAPPSPAPSVEEHSGHDQPKTEVIPDNKSTGSSKRKDSVVKDRQVSQHKKQSSSGREDDNSESGEGSSEEEDGSSEEEYYDDDNYDYDDEDEDEDDEKEDDDDEEYESSDDEGSNNLCKSSKKLGTKSRKSLRESVRLGDNSTRKSAADQDDKPIGQKSQAKSSKSRCKRRAKSHKLSDGDTNGSVSRGKSKSLCAKSSKASKRRSSRHKDGSKSSKRSEDDDGMFSFGSGSFRSGNGSSTRSS